VEIDLSETAENSLNAGQGNSTELVEAAFAPGRTNPVGHAVGGQENGVNQNRSMTKKQVMTMNPMRKASIFLVAL
jgi:hypothetical protein